MKTMDGHFEGCGGTTLYYQTWLPEGEQKASVIIVHGVGEYIGRYAHMAAYFTKRGYGVYGYDHRGHGHSPGVRGHINNWEEYREDLRLFQQFVSQSAPAVPLFLYGHSMGALISLDYLQQQPAGLQGAIISGAPLAVGTSPLLMLAAKILSKIKPDMTLNTGLDTKGLSSIESEVQAYEADPLVHPFGSARWGASFMARIEEVKSKPDAFVLPLFFVHGSQDPICLPEPAQAFYEQISEEDKTMKVYQGSYHEIHNDFEQQQEFEDIYTWMEARL